jgi:hypothetical protein
MKHNNSIDNKNEKQASGKNKLMLNKRTIVKFSEKQMQNVAGGKDLPTTNSSGAIGDDKCTGHP